MALPALLIGFIAWRAWSPMDSAMPAETQLASLLIVLHTRSLSEAVNVGWTVILLILVIFAVVWIAQWIRHTLAKIPAAGYV